MQRSAAHIINGFRYQFMRSLLAWLHLQPGEELWLEVSEDYSVRSAEQTHDVQVKASRATAGSTRYSLQSADIKAALSRFWARTTGADGVRHRMTFVANGGVARERDVAFPNGVAGLDYWARASRDADTQPLRAALSTVFQGEPLSAWLASNPSDDILRERLLRNVHWALSEQPVDALAVQLRDQVGAIYLLRNLPVMAAEQGWRTLLDIIADTSRLADPAQRVLRVSELHAQLEKIAATFEVAKLMGAATALATQAPHGVLIADLESTAHSALRTETVSEILMNARGEQTIWLHGSHGVGKSTLARLLAAQTGGRWIMLDLQPIRDDPVAALSVWRELQRDVASRGLPDGIIIDDLDSKAFDVLRLRIAALLPVLGERGGRLILTSHVLPSPARLADVGATPNTLMHAPYFTENDVRDLVQAAAAPVDRIDIWGVFVRVSTHGGHPLLVTAKIASLRERGWPNDALLEDFGSGPSEAVRLTRDEARMHLLQELSAFGDARSQAAGQVLRRIGAVYDRVDHDLALLLCRLEPAVQMPGDALTLLKGSWLEALPDADFRVSPLLSDIANDVSQEESRHWRCVAAEYWLSKRVLNERTLPLCFWNAFWGKHSAVLLKIFQVIQSQPRHIVQGAAAMLAPMMALVTDAWFYPDNLVIAANLRLLQFEVANALEEERRGVEIAERLLVEIDALDNLDLRALLTAIAVPKVLMAENVRVSYRLALDYAVRLRVETPRIEQLGGPSITRMAENIFQSLGPNISVQGFLVASTAIKVRSSQDFLAFARALDDIPAGDREDILNASSAIYDGLSVFVSTGWSRDQLDGRDMAIAAECYADAEQVIAPWGRADLMIEMAVARSVIADEGASDVDSALAIIEAARAAYGNESALIRQKAKVLGHYGRDGEAADLILSVQDTVGGASRLERALALRDGAASAAKVGRFLEAARLFALARDALGDNPFNKALAVGLMVDDALALWSAGDRYGGLGRLADVFDALEHLDPAESKQNQRAHQFARGVGGLFNFDADPFPYGDRPTITFGGASALERQHEPLSDVELKPLADNWRILALVEIEIGGEGDIEARSAAKQDGPGIISIEGVIAAARFARALARGDDPSSVFELGCVAVETMRLAAESGGQLARGNAPAFADLDLAALAADVLWCQAVSGIAIDALMLARYRGQWTPAKVDAWRGAYEGHLSGNAFFEGFFKVAGGCYSIGQDALFSFAVARTIAVDSRVVADDPVLRFRHDLNVVGYVAQSLARRELESLIVEDMRSGWSDVLSHQRFGLRSPLRNCPAMETAVADLDKDGLRAAARLLLAAAPAVDEALTPNWEQMLRRIGRLN